MLGGPLGELCITTVFITLRPTTILPGALPGLSSSTWAAGAGDALDGVAGMAANGRIGHCSVTVLYLIDPVPHANWAKRRPSGTNG